jgi:precorrin-6B methylase 1
MYECQNRCGSTTFRQTVKQTETVHVDAAGDPCYFETGDHLETLSVKCAECGAGIEP